VSSQIESLDVLAILGVLVDFDVDFVVIGAVAVAHHGFVRGTKDVDIVPNPAPNNLDKLFRALHALEASPLGLQGFRREELPVDLSPENLALGGNWDLSTKHGRLDVMQYIGGALESVEDYVRMRRESVASRFEFGTVHFVGFDELLDLKTIAGRDLDLADIRALREARGAT
jgi:hypothetical protein